MRHIRFGEGGYADTEKLIRELLTAADPSVRLPDATDVVDETPPGGATTPESYLGTTKQVNFAGAEKYSAATSRFRLPAEQPADSFALGGQWTLGTQSIEAAPGSDPAEIRLNYTAAEVRMVLAGSGTVTVSVDGQPRSIEVSGVPRSYELLNVDAVASGSLTVTLPPGVQAFSFTFG